MDEFLKTLPSVGVGGVLAYIMFYWYRKDVEKYTDQWKGQTELLAALIKENTTAMVGMGVLVKSLYEHMIHSEIVSNRRENERRKDV